MASGVGTGRLLSHFAVDVQSICHRQEFSDFVTVTFHQRVVPTRWAVGGQGEEASLESSREVTSSALVAQQLQQLHYVPCRPSSVGPLLFERGFLEEPRGGRL